MKSYFYTLSGRIRKQMPSVFAFALLAGLVGNVLYATHYAGTDLSYTWVSGSTYRFQQRIYRDCEGIALTNSTGLILSPATPSSSILLTRTTIREITPICPTQISRCVSTAGAFGIEEHVYEATATLAANTQYTLATNLIARNTAITTVSNPGNQTLYCRATLKTGINNQSAVFLNPPIGFFCANQPAVMSPNAYDADGDSLVYSLTNCLSNNGAVLPYLAGFNATNPLTTSNGLQLNTATGQLNFRPTVVGQVAVICVQVTEFRNGQAIGTTVRDMQVRILSCNNTPPVVAPLPSVIVPVGQTYCVNAIATDANNDNVSISATAGILPPATFTPSTSGPGYATGTFCFTPTTADIGHTYTVTINAQDDACPLPGIGAAAFNITVPAPCNMQINLSGINPGCGAAANSGSISTTIQGGTAPYTASWTGPAGYSSNALNPSGLQAGTYTVHVTDAFGCCVSQSITLSTQDSTPPVALCQSITVELGANGQASVSASLVNAGSSDNCGPVTLALSQTQFDCEDIGQNQVVLTVTDPFGNTATCTATVTIVDSLAPAIQCPSDLLIGCIGDLPAPDLNGLSASDNCSGVTLAYLGESITGGPGCSTSPIVVVRTFSATDSSGNSSSCSQTITVQGSPVTAEASSSNVVFPAWADSSCSLLSVIPGGGCPPYSYQWSNGATTDTTTVCPDSSSTYYVTVTDALGCEGIDSVMVCAIDILCGDDSNNGLNGTGQSGNGVNQNTNARRHIAICHVPPGNPANAMTQCLPIPAAMQHIPQHPSDHLGACGTLDERGCGPQDPERVAERARLSNVGFGMEVFPNPFSNAAKVQLATTEAKQISVKVFDLAGRARQLLFEGNLEAGSLLQLELNASELGNGMFFVEAMDQDGNRNIVKIQVIQF